MNCGYELKESSAKGEGVFARQSFKIGDVVIVGIIEKLLNRNHSHASQIGEFEFVLHAGLTRKVNHSCDPNCGIEVNKCGAHNFVAIKDFADGDEITFDYAMRNYTVDHFPLKCGCGSKKCRGKITGWKDLTRQKKKEYRHVAAPYLLEMDARCPSKVEVIVSPDSSTRREPALS